MFSSPLFTITKFKDAHGIQKDVNKGLYSIAYI